MHQDGASPNSTEAVRPFFEQPNVQMEWIAVNSGIPLGIERRYNPQVGIGGAYGAWGESYDNETLFTWIAQRLGEPLSEGEKMNLSPLGFDYRHHIPQLSPDEHLELEVQVGARILSEAASANGWAASTGAGPIGRRPS